MNFAEQPPSKEWAGLKYRGERIAEVWFKPEGEPCALTFRIPLESFQVADIRQRLTIENLLKAVAIPCAEVESWHHGGAADAGMDGAQPDLGQALPLPAHDDTHLTIQVRLKAPAEAMACRESGAPEIPPDRWQEVEARWNALLALETSLDTFRISMESLRSEMEAASRHTLATEEKQHALSADMAQWNQLKSRLVYALPKVREFIHRAIWALGTPERKKLEEFFKTHERADVPLAQLDPLHKQLDHLLKERQVLSAQGATIHQECKRIAADTQGALRNLRNNAAASAAKKKGANRMKRKKG